jgi:hypothetical protein
MPSTANVQPDHLLKRARYGGRPVHRLLLSLASCALAATQAIAGPQIGQLRQSDLEPAQFCQFSATRAGRGVVLELKHWEAKLRLNDELVRLSVREQKCLGNCVGPGGSGVRAFQLSGQGVRATLTKRVTCARDAQTCAGLEEGNAKLTVFTSAGRAVASIWGKYCDM